MIVRTLSSLALCLTLGTAARADEARPGNVWPATRDSYPEELNRRPLTLPAGVVEPAADLQVVRISTSGLLGTTVGSSTQTAELLDVGASVGVTDRVQLSAGTGFQLNPDAAWDKIVVPRLAFLGSHTDGVDVAPSVAVPLHFGSNQSTFSDVVVGFDTRALLNRFVALYLLQNLIDFQTEGHLEVAIDFPVAVGLQLTRELNLQFGTNLFVLSSRSSSDSQLIFKDFIPFTTQLLFAAGNRADFFAGMTIPDLKHAGDLFVFSGGIRFRI